MAISESKLDEVSKLMGSFNNKEICKKLGINEETLNRYKRGVRERNRLGVGGGDTRVLLLDIETLPAEGYMWKMWDVNFSVEQIISSTCMLGYAVKWLFMPEIYSDILTPEEARKKDDKRIVNGLWEYMNSASVVIAHNGRAFDTQYANARFIVHNLPPPAPYKIIDTLYIKKNTKFDMNSLEYLCKELGLRPKIDTEGFSLWKRCRHGDKDALNDMKTYNEGDVLSLEELYVRIRPWLPSHPNLGLFVEGKNSVCPRCTHDKFVSVGKYATSVNLYESYRCLNCGAIMRSRVSATPRSKKPNLMVNVNAS